MSSVPALLGPFVRTGAPAAIVRPPQNDYHAINWLFDQGVAGVLVPMVNTPEEARAAVRAAKFPPVGRRSFGPFRAAKYGRDLERYMPEADSESTLIIQIEDGEAARNIDEILAVPGIDAVFMGPNDLGYSLLKPGQSMRGNPGQWSAFTRTQEVLDLCAHVLERARVAGKPFGTTASSMDDARDWFNHGAQFITWGSDFLFLRRGAEILCEFERGS